jgi:hypothetical protein
MIPFKYIVYVDGMSIRKFRDRNAAQYFCDGNANASLERIPQDKNPPKEKLNTNDYPECLF